MPMMVNRHGVVVCFPAERIDDAYHQGLRVLEPTDEAWLRDSNETFAIPAIEGHARGCWGKFPVMVTGKGPSAVRIIPDHWSRIVVNQADPSADAVVALDSDFWLNLHGAPLSPIKLAPKGIDVGGIEGVQRFHMPMQRGEADVKQGRIAVNLGNMAIQQAHFSGIAAMLVALYMTTGPVILSGFDLSGVDAAEVPYIRQERGWEAASKVVDRVYLHPSMTGPLTKFYPTWEGR